jgi:hypothetical protein
VVFFLTAVEDGGLPRANTTDVVFLLTAVVDGATILFLANSSFFLPALPRLPSGRPLLSTSFVLVFRLA